MGAEGAFKVGGVTGGLAAEGMLHGQRVEEEVAEEDAHGEEEEGGVGRGLAGLGLMEVVQVHGYRYESVEERHQHAGQDGQDDALAVGAAGAALLAARCQSVDDDGHHDERYSGEEQGGIALGLSEIVDDDSEHQGQAYAYREGYAHAGQRDGGREQDVGGIEDDAADDGADDGGSRHLAQVGHKTAAFAADAA